jgi:hypothetical protein
MKAAPRRSEPVPCGRQGGRAGRVSAVSVGDGVSTKGHTSRARSAAHSAQRHSLPSPTNPTHRQPLDGDHSPLGQHRRVRPKQQLCGGPVESRQALYRQVLLVLAAAQLTLQELLLRVFHNLGSWGGGGRGGGAQGGRQTGGLGVGLAQAGSTERLTAGADSQPCVATPGGAARRAPGLCPTLGALTSRTTGFRLSSRYAPTPRFSFSAAVHALNASVTPCGWSHLRVSKASGWAGQGLTLPRRLRDVPGSGPGAPGARRQTRCCHQMPTLQP